MTREPLATLSGSRAGFREMVNLAALGTGDGVYYDEMLVRVTADRVETPAGKRETSMAAYCTVEHGAFDGVSLHIDEPAVAIFDIEAALGWLEWLEADDVDVVLLGDPGDAFAGTLEFRTDAETVQVACRHGPEILGEVTTELPSRFDDADRFRLEDGSRAPTLVETTAGELERLADAVELAETVDGYPVVVADGRFELDVGSELSLAHARTTLDGKVTGPDVANRYSADLAALARALDGDVVLQTGPDEPLVVVQTHSLFTLRYVLLPASW
ncbi:hypothetical protein G9C85_01305 [Halorubellus sp. JP-L1]|uniref:hypothetical protein n=1 Tax=Halorubellus sp. JP-L1 TaxID=2715753 RepID=UPI00140A1F6B|nr:hypothetical protein [Halorubellus sp. JP-L1]NHN40273.1 hypothetical protein [Halorubellus sp. JP-L1]